MIFYNLIKTFLLQNTRKFIHTKFILTGLSLIFIFEFILVHSIFKNGHLGPVLINYINAYEVLIWFFLSILFFASGVKSGVSYLTEEKRPHEGYLFSLPISLPFVTLMKILRGMVMGGLILIFLIPWVFCYKYISCSNLITAGLGIFSLLLLYLLCFLQGYLVALLLLIKLPYTIRVAVVGCSYVFIAVISILLTIFLLPLLNIERILLFLNDLFFLPSSWANKGQIGLLLVGSGLNFYLCLFLSIRSEHYDKEFESNISEIRGYSLIKKWDYLISSFIKAHIRSNNPIFVLLKKDLLYFVRNLLRVFFIIPPLIIPFLFLLTGKIHPILIFPLYYIPVMLAEDFTFKSIVGEGYNIIIYKLLFPNFRAYFTIKIMSNLFINLILSVSFMSIYSIAMGDPIKIVGLRVGLILIAVLSAVISAVGIGVLCADFERGDENVRISNFIGKPSYLIFKFFSVPIIFTIIDYLLFSSISVPNAKMVILFLFIPPILMPFLFIKAAYKRLANFEHT